MNDFLNEMTTRAKQLTGNVNKEKVLESLSKGRPMAPEALSDDDLAGVTGGTYTDAYHIKTRTAEGGLIEYVGIDTCRVCGPKKLGFFYQLEGVVACEDCLKSNANF